MNTIGPKRKKKTTANAPPTTTTTSKPDGGQPTIAGRKPKFGLYDVVEHVLSKERASVIKACTLCSRHNSVQRAQCDSKCKLSFTGNYYVETGFAKSVKVHERMLKLVERAEPWETEGEDRDRRNQEDPGQELPPPIPPKDEKLGLP